LVQDTKNDSINTKLGILGLAIISIVGIAIMYKVLSGKGDSQSKKNNQT
jgi:hypothetical protein